MNDYNLIPKSKVEKDCLEWCPLYYQHKNGELIHKSKIEEKIEKVQYYKDLSSSCWDNNTNYDYAIKVLEELLESEENK